MSKNAAVGEGKAVRGLHKRRRAALAVIGGALLLLAAFFALSHLLPPKKWDPDIATNETLRGFYDEPRDTIDVIAIGPSPIYNDVMPTELFAAHGFTAYNLSMPRMRMLIAELYLKEALRYQKPRVLVLGSMLFSELGYSTWETRYRTALTPLRFSLDKLRVCAQIARGDPNQSLASYLVPFLRYHDRWNELTAEDIAFYARPAHFAEKGWACAGYTAHGRTIGDWKQPTDSVDDAFDPDALAALERIIALCGENDIQLVMIGLPVMVEDYSYARMNGVAKFCAQRGIPLLEMNDPQTMAELDIDFEFDFSGRSHLNVYGAVKATRRLGAFLAEHCDLPDRRAEPLAAAWNADVAETRAVYLEKLASPLADCPIRAEATDAGVRLSWRDVTLFDTAAVTRRAADGETRAALPDGAAAYLDESPALPCEYTVTLAVAGFEARAASFTVRMDGAGRVVADGGTGVLALTDDGADADSAARSPTDGKES